MDVIMPNKDGIDACREIMELLPDTRVMMLTASSEEDAIEFQRPPARRATFRSIHDRRSWWKPFWMWPKVGCAFLTMR